MAAVQDSSKRRAAPPAPQPVRRDFLGGQVSTLRKPQQIVIKTRKDTPPELLDRIAAQVTALVEEFEKQQEG